MKVFNAKIYLKEQLCIIRIIDGSAIQCHLNVFDFMLIYQENVDVKIEDADKAILWVVSLPASYKHFNEITFYSNNKTLALFGKISGSSSR